MWTSKVNWIVLGGRIPIVRKISFWEEEFCFYGRIPLLWKNFSFMEEFSLSKPNVSQVLTTATLFWGTWVISEKGGSFLEKGGAADFRKRGLLKITFYTFIFKEELYRQNMYTMLLKIGVDFLKIGGWLSQNRGWLWLQCSDTSCR